MATIALKTVPGGVCAAKGFKAAGTACGIRKKPGKKDLALIVSSVPASAAAVYTTNLVKGAPLTVTKHHLADGKAQAVICNSGNANTCNADGIEIAESVCFLLRHTCPSHPSPGGFRSSLQPSQRRAAPMRARR